MDRAFVGMGATILNGSVIESGGVLAAGGLLTAGKRIASQELWGGTPAKLLRVLSAAEVTEFSDVAQHYVRNAARFRADCKIH